MQQEIKQVVAVCGGWLCAAVSPAIPMAVACTAVVIADAWTARRLRRRLARRKPSPHQLEKFASARLGKVVGTLTRIYAALLVAALVQNAITGEWSHLLEFVAGLVCFWQGISILENEATLNPHPWARILRRLLAE